MWCGCDGECDSSSGSNNLIEKLNGEIFDVRRGMKRKLKNLNIASVFADFAAGGGQWWPLNVSVGWGERTSLCERGQHNNQKQVSKRAHKNTTTNNLHCFGSGDASTHDWSGIT